MTDDREYYSLEAFVFGEVSGRFRSNGSTDAFDLMSIVIWKANRSKSVVAKGLMKIAGPAVSLDNACRRLTRELHDATDDESRFRVMWDWGFRLPMASAILAVFFPDSFTVYDYRVCGQLNDAGYGDFSGLDEKRPFTARWAGYEAFIAAVRESSPCLSLRDADRTLMGRSQARQLRADIASWSSSEAAS